MRDSLTYQVSFAKWNIFYGRFRTEMYTVPDVPLKLNFAHETPEVNALTTRGPCPSQPEVNVLHISFSVKLTHCPMRYLGMKF